MGANNNKREEITNYVMIAHNCLEKCDMEKGFASHSMKIEPRY